MADPKHCEGYERLVTRLTLLALIELLGAGVTSPESPEEELRLHASTCPECRALAQARREAIAPPAGDAPTTNR